MLSIVLTGLLLAPAQAVPEHGRSSAPDSNPGSVPNWSVNIVNDQVKNATALCVDDQGNLYVAESYRWREGVQDNRDHTYWIMDDLACETVADRSRVYAKWKDKFQEEDFFTRFSDRVVRLEDRDRDGKLETLVEFASGFDTDVTGPAIGLLSGDLGIYLTCVPDLWLLRDNNNDGRADERQSLQTGFGVKTSLAGHDLHGLTWGPDGRLYFSMGDRGFNCTTREGRVLKDSNSGAVFRCNPDGSQMEIFYHRLRNPQELAFNEYGDLFTVDNNCDQGDSARICYLLEGGSSGWHLGAQAQTTYRAHIHDGQINQPPHWLAEGVWKLRFDRQPAHILPPVAHLTNGPAGLAFNSGIGFPARYQNHFLVCDYKGAPNLCFLYSFRVQQHAAGYTAEDEHMVRGGIPVTDVEVGYNGKIYVTDFGGGWFRSDQGNVYELFDPETIEEPAVAELSRLVQAGFHRRTDAELLGLLSHRDFRVRLRSQYELAARGSRNVAALAQLANQADTVFARFHAIWALGQLQAVEPLLPLLADSDGEIRAQTVRTIGQLADSAAASAIRRLLTDDHPRVRTFTAIALGKLNDRDAVPALVEVLERNADRDAFERHAAVYALSQLASNQQLAGLANHSSSAVRLGAVLALRRQRSAAVGAFLSDSDDFVVAEAIRAINDEWIDDALPALCEYTARLAEAQSPIQLDELLYRRLVNGCLRSGGPDDANTLVRLAANSNISTTYRIIALQVLSNMVEPPPIDATLGLYHQLPPRDQTVLGEAIEPALRQVFEDSTGDLATAAILAMDRYRIRLDESSLVRRLRDGRQPVEVRQVAVRQLFESPRREHEVLLKSLLVDESPALRASAARAYVQAFPHEAEPVLRNLLSMGEDSDYRTVYDLLASSSSTQLITVLCEQLDQLLSGKLYRTVRLDLYEAAERSADPRVRAKLAEVNQMLMRQAQTPDEYVREGGDPVQGRLVFQNQGVCLKCHRADRGGGNAGPELTNIGRLRRSDELLESIREPNAEVVPGYGTITAYLDDGKVVSGTLLDQSEDLIRIVLPTGETRQLDMDEIDEVSDITSPMPKQADSLTRQEIRDLIAFLKQLDGRRP